VAESPLAVVLLVITRNVVHFAAVTVLATLLMGSIKRRWAARRNATGRLGTDDE
jgi:hypothetical protein